MTDPATYQSKADALHAKLETRLGLKTKRFEARLTKAMGRFPKPVRRAAKTILDARAQMQHPKLARLVDPAGLDNAFDTVQRHLKTVDIQEERITRILGTLGAMVFNLVLLGLGLVLFLRWQGLM